MSIPAANAFVTTMDDAYTLIGSQEYADQQAAIAAQNANILYNDCMNTAIRHFSMSAQQLADLSQVDNVMQHRVPMGMLGSRVAEFTAAWEAQGYVVTTDNGFVVITCP